MGVGIGVGVGVGVRGGLTTVRVVWPEDAPMTYADDSAPSTHSRRLNCPHGEITGGQGQAAGLSVHDAVISVFETSIGVAVKSGLTDGKEIKAHTAESDNLRRTWSCELRCRTARCNHSRKYNRFGWDDHRWVDTDGGGGGLGGVLC